MVQAFINIPEHTNWILNLIKAKYSLKDKSEAIAVMAEKFEQEMLEPSLRPEYVKKAVKISRQKAVPVGSVADLRKRYL